MKYILDAPQKVAISMSRDKKKNPTYTHNTLTHIVMIIFFKFYFHRNARIDWEQGSTNIRSGARMV